jgi:Spy/CpxP family protein refolding chaperone
MKNTVLVAVVLAALICVMPVWSQGPGGPGGPRGMGGMMMFCPAMAIAPPPVGAIDRITESLQLTTDQTTKMKTVMTTADETTATLTKKAADATKALRDATMATTFDATKVKDLAASAEKAEAAVVSNYIDEWTQIRAIITADQVTKLQEATAMRRPAGNGQRPNGPPPGGDGAPPQGQDGPPPPTDQ